MLIHGDWMMGDTGVVLGVYKLVEGLRALAAWTRGVYRDTHISEPLTYHLTLYDFDFLNLLIQTIPTPPPPDSLCLDIKKYYITV